MSSIKNGFPAAKSFVFEFNSEDEARGSLACDARSVLQILEKWNCTDAIVRIAGQGDMLIPLDTIRMMAQFKPVIELFFADTSLPPSVLKAAAIQSEEEESKWGIVRLRDEQQVVMSSGMGGELLAGVGIDQTTKDDWKRPLFWHPEDLANFNRDWSRQLAIEKTSVIEYRYRIHKPRSNDPWEYYRSSYRLLQGNSANDLYQMCTFIDRG